MSYIIQVRETGTFIAEYNTYEEAQDMIASFEDCDREEETYTTNFYEIKEKGIVNNLLNFKLKEFKINLTYDGILTENYQIIGEPTLTDFGQLYPIYNWVKVEIKAAYHNNRLFLIMLYYWRHSTGGGNGYTLYLDYPVPEN